MGILNRPSVRTSTLEQSWYEELTWSRNEQEQNCWATRTPSTQITLPPAQCTTRSWTNVSQGSMGSKNLARTPRGLVSWLRATTRTRFGTELVGWPSWVWTPRSVCCALPSFWACATRSPSLLGRVGTVCTNMYPMDPSTKSYLTRRANENGGLLGKVEKEKVLLKQELIARIKGGQLFYKPEGSYTAVGH